MVVNSTSTNLLPDDILKQFVLGLMDVMEQGTKEFARVAWSISLHFLAEHWLSVIGTFIVLLIFLVIKAALGEWGALYSLTYWTLYAVIIFIVGLIFGPEALVSDIYYVIYIVAIWPLCYLTTALIWDRFDFRKQKR